jgi:inorganic pyrophosphatase
MFIDKIPAFPTDDEVNVIIEIPMNSDPVKYEFDKESGAVMVDRFMQTAMFYPCNYGFIPHTLSGDGDPVDVLVISNYPLLPGCVIRARPVAVLIMEDESGADEKIIAVPGTKLDVSFKGVSEPEDIAQIVKDRIIHFFEHYKDLDKGKWVKVIGFEGSSKARSLIDEGALRHQSQKA